MNNKNLNYSDLFDQEFLNLAGIEDRPIKGILSYMDLQEVHKDINYVGNYFDSRYLEFNSRYLEPQGIYIPFGSKSISGSERKAANEIFHDCLIWLEKFTLSVIESKAKGKNGYIALPEKQYITNYQFGKYFYVSSLNGKIIELKNKGSNCVCVGPQNILDNLKQDLNKIADIDYIFINNNLIGNNKAYIFTENSVAIGYRMKFMFFSKPDIYRPNTILCQAQGEFDAVRVNENSILVIDC